MIMRETKDIDLNDILCIEREAFKSNKEAELTRDMLADPNSKPLMSFIAFIENQPVGHILFTTAHLSNNPNEVSISL